MLPINTPVATTVSARPSKNGTRGPFASVLSEKFNLMAQDKDHSEIPEWRVQIPARPDRIVTAVAVVHAVVPVGLLGMGLHKAKSENNLKVGMLQSANTMVLFLRVGLTWSLYLSTWYTESFGPVGSEDSNNFTPISRVCKKKKKWGWVAIRCLRVFFFFINILSELLYVWDFWYFIHFRFDLWYYSCVALFMVYFHLS